MVKPKLSPKWSRALFGFAVFLLAGIGVVRIVLTYSVFSQTYDEPAHVAAGMEWLDRGEYTYEDLHPPLARVAVAIGPFLHGARLSGTGDMWWEGNQILHYRGQYLRNLTLARLGVLPFFLIATAVVCIWAERNFGKTAALFAVLMFTTTPPVLAHAGLATTDMPLTATFGAALLAFVVWVEHPTLPRSLLLGLGAAAAVLSKFSALLFLPVCGFAILACRWLTTEKGETPQPRRPNLLSVGVAVLAALILTWGSYRFSVFFHVNGPHNWIDSFLGNSGPLHHVAYRIVESVPIPAPELFTGLKQLRKENSVRRECYLLGHVYSSGCPWYFHLVAFAVKTPIPFLLFTGTGVLILAWRMTPKRTWNDVVPAVAAGVVLLLCLPFRIKLGLRHLLPIYPLLSIVAGLGAASIWNVIRRERVARGAVLALLSWQLISSAQIHPDYLSYFNEVAGRRPDLILVDSDLDWGQDLLRLADAVRTRRIDTIRIAYWGTAYLDQQDLPRMLPLIPYQRATGWIAISETKLKLFKGYDWLEQYEPIARAGKSILIYYISSSSSPPGSS